MVEKDIICIVCPVGCHLTVKGEDLDSLEVSGNKCPRGDKYGKKELSDPRRVVPTTVRIENGLLARLPVKTSEPIPKPMIFDIMKEVKKVKLEAPVHTGDVVIENILNTGVDLVATRDMPRI